MPILSPQDPEYTTAESAMLTMHFRRSLYKLTNADLQELRDAVEAEMQPSARARSQAKRAKASE